MHVDYIVVSAQKISFMPIEIFDGWHIEGEKQIERISRGACTFDFWIGSKDFNEPSNSDARSHA